MRRSTSPFVLSLLGAIESISSMKMIAGEFFSASSKALRRLDSDSPACAGRVVRAASTASRRGVPQTLSRDHEDGVAEA